MYHRKFYILVRSFRKTFFIFDTFQFILAAEKGFSLFQKLTQTEAPSGQVIKPQKLGHIFKEKEIWLIMD